MRLLLEAEAMTALRCSKSTIKRLRRDKKILGSSGRPVRYCAASVEAYAQSLFCRPTVAETGRSDAEIAARAQSDALKRRLKKAR